MIPFTGFRSKKRSAFRPRVEALESRFNLSTTAVLPPDLPMIQLPDETPIFEIPDQPAPAAIVPPPGKPAAVLTVQLPAAPQPTLETLIVAGFALARANNIAPPLNPYQGFAPISQFQFGGSLETHKNEASTIPSGSALFGVGAELVKEAEPVIGLKTAQKEPVDSHIRTVGLNQEDDAENPSEAILIPDSPESEKPRPE